MASSPIRGVVSHRLQSADNGRSTAAIRPIDTDRRYARGRTFVKVGRRRLYLGQHPIERQSRHAKITTERLPRATIEVSTSAQIQSHYSPRSRSMMQGASGQLLPT